MSPSHDAPGPPAARTSGPGTATAAASPAARRRPGRDLARAFGFFTVLPAPVAGTIDDIARAGYLLPLVAIVLGALEGATGWGGSGILGPPAGAALTLAAALLLTGFHHADGLADVGDGIMAHGDAGRRIEVLKDRTLGTGAVLTLLLVYLTSWTALAELYSLRQGAELIAILVVAELSARLSLLAVIVFSRPSHQGSGSSFSEAMKGWRGGAGLALSLAALAVSCIFTQPLAVLLAAGAAAGLALAVILMARRLFGGSGGDVFGASVELGRLAALLALAAAFHQIA